VNDIPYKDRPPLSIVFVKFIIKTITKNSITRIWSYIQIAAEISNIPG
jgi:hypothetical protein